MNDLYPYQKQALSALFNLSEQQIEDTFNELNASLLAEKQPLSNSLNRMINKQLSMIVDYLITDEINKLDSLNRNALIELINE